MIYLKRDTILGEFMCLFKLRSILKTRVTNLGEQSAILTSRDGYEGDFFILLSVHVCFNSYIDYAICKHDYE